jgi:hypothetical protein
MCCLAQQLPMRRIAFIRRYFLMGLMHRWNQSITLIHFGAELIAQSCSFDYAIRLVRTLVLAAALTVHIQR